VDAFAGRGIYPGGERGSPLRVLDLASTYTARGHKVRCHFIEPNPENHAILRAAVEDHEAFKSGQVQCITYNSYFSECVPAIIDEIRAARQGSFFFVDPFGFEDPSMDLLGTVLNLRYAEVFVNLMFNFVNMAISAPGHADTMDRLFGAPDWRAATRLHDEARERALIELYRRELKRRGSAFVLPFRMGADERDRTLYYLVHATKHIKGASVMKDAMVASGSSGRLEYAGEARHGMIPLFDMDVENLPRFLLERFAGQTLSFDDVFAASIENSGACRERDYRNALKQLERSSAVTVRRMTSKTSRGLSGKDEITFPGK
jgi:three-Cys-motif partner protein